VRLIFTAYNRPHYFDQVLRSWAGVRGVSDWKPTVHLEPSAQQAQMARLAQAHLGADVRTNPRKLGVLENPFQALDTAFATDEFVVLAEDDVTASDDILEYFTWAAATFRNDHNILAVCACSKDTQASPDDEYTVAASKAFDPLIWGTWHDRWATTLRATWDHDYSSGTPEAPQSGWDWNINLRVIGERWVAKPYASRSNHIGRRDGTHTTVFTFPGTVSPTFRPHRPPGPYRYAPRAIPQ
jgi:hypothetical protein